MGRCFYYQEDTRRPCPEFGDNMEGEWQGQRARRPARGTCAGAGCVRSPGPACPPSRRDAGPRAAAGGAAAAALQAAAAGPAPHLQPPARRRAPRPLRPPPGEPRARTCPARLAAPRRAAAGFTPDPGGSPAWKEGCLLSAHPAPRASAALCRRASRRGGACDLPPPGPELRGRRSPPSTEAGPRERLRLSHLTGSPGRDGPNHALTFEVQNTGGQ